MVMIDPSLHALERDVEATRARLERHLRTLRSPTAHAEFTEALKHDAVALKDDVVERTRSAAQDRLDGWIDGLKARAAENPAAVLAIAAGIGWRMVRHPPIATALVGVGLFSLLRGNAPARTGRSDNEYLDHAQARLREQSSELAAGVAEQARALAANAGEQVERWSEDARAAVQRGSAQAADMMEHWSGEARAAVQKGSAEAAGKMEAWSEEARAAMRNAKAQAVDASVATAAAASERLDTAWQNARDRATRSTAQIQRAASDAAASATGPEFTNQLLLGAAGAAVAAAVAVAVQRRVADTERVG
jgi:hypothetical protein